MNKKSSILSKMADKLLNVAGRSDAFNESKKKQDKIKRLHEAISEKYKFSMNLPIHSMIMQETTRDIQSLKAIEKKLTLTPSDEATLERLFYKYRIQ